MRLPDLRPEDLDPEQRALYDDIVGGPRGAGPQHFPLTTRDGALTGPFGVMIHGPALGRPLQELGSAVRYATGLTDRVREIAILAVAAATGSAFEQHAHERVGRAVGLTDVELVDLSAGTVHAGRPRRAVGVRPLPAPAGRPSATSPRRSTPTSSACSARRRSPS